MIDNIKLTLQYSNREFTKLAERLRLNAPIASNKISVDWANLRINYYPNSNKLTVSNSLHKFYNLEFNELVRQPVNHNNFTFENFCAVAHYLSEGVFEKDITDLTISTRFEFGLNIYTETNSPFNLISKYQSSVCTHCNDFFTVPPLKGKPNQRNCHFSDYYIKVYEKNKQSALINTNLLRYEIVVTEIRKLRSILQHSDLTVYDLCIPENWDRLFNYLVSTYDSIRKIPQIEAPNISNAEIVAIYSFCNKQMREDLKKNSSKYFFRLLNRNNKEVYTNYNISEANYHNIIRKSMHSKYQELAPWAST